MPYVEEPTGDHEFDSPIPTEPAWGNAKRCTADRLDAELAGWAGQGDGGEPGARRPVSGLIGMVRVTLRSGADCTLQGEVSARLRIDGNDAPVQYSNHVIESARQQVTLVTAQSPAELRVGWSPPYCGPTGAQELLIDLPGGGGILTAPVRTPSTPVCSSGSEGDRGLRTFISLDIFTAYHGPTRVDSPLRFLVATTEGAPSQVRPGQLIGYGVRLSNPSGQDVPLTPCPGFITKRAIVGGVRPGFNTAVVSRLNCRPVKVVPAHGSVVFQMQAQVPPSPPGGPNFSVDWRLLAPFLSGGPGQATGFNAPFRG